MGINNGLPYAATPIDPDEAEGLIPSISTRAELNAFEALNIAEALGWAHRNKKIHRDLLSIEALRLLHKRMFNKTWHWAGAIRITEKSIGVAPHEILPGLRARRKGLARIRFLPAARDLGQVPSQACTNPPFP